MLYEVITDILKVDRSFVTDLAASEATPDTDTDIAIVRGIVARNNFV